MERNVFFWFFAIISIASIAMVGADDDKRSGRGRGGDGAERNQRRGGDGAERNQRRGGDGAENQRREARQAAQEANREDRSRRDDGNDARSPLDTRMQWRGDNSPRRDNSSRRQYSRQNLDQGRGFSKSQRDSLREHAKKFRDQRRTLDPNEINRKTREFQKNYRQREGYQRDASRNLASKVRGAYPDYRSWFNNDYQRYHRNPDYWQNNVYWWGRPQWGNVNQWLGWNNSAYPYYYDEGYPLQVDSYIQDYYRNYNNNNYSDDYYTNLYDYSVDGLQDWMPLGVFALGSNVEEASRSVIYMQLVINRDGDLTGTYYNTSTKRSFPLEGYVDPGTQEVYWMVPGEREAPEMITGLYNLMEDVAGVQLTFPDGPIQNWILVRISD